MKLFRSLLAFSLLIMIMVYFSFAPTAQAQTTINVTTFDDELNTNNECSLREAITNANNGDQTYADCASGAGSDVIIDLPAGTYTLTITGTGNDSNETGDLDIAIGSGRTLTIMGDSPGSTIIDANGIDRALHLLSGNVVLENLTITGGYTIITDNGAGVLHAGDSLIVDNVLIDDNESEADNGGGIAHFAGTLTIRDSTLSNNTAFSRGGGLYTVNSGNILIERSLFLNNSGTNGGGGGIYMESNTVNVSNTTFTGNSGATNGGGIWVGPGNGELTINNSTFYNNGPGNGRAIRNFSSVAVVLRNTVLLRGSADANLCTTNAGGFSASDSLADDNSCTGTATDASDIALDATLRQNGGPTLTHALLPGSVAIDGGENATCAATDQRGLTRPVDYTRDGTPTCDVGAFERQAAEAHTATVDTNETVSFGTTLVTIVNNDDTVSLGTVTVTRQNQPPGGSFSEGEMPFHVNINADVNTGLDIDLTLCYTDWEVGEGDNVNEELLELYRWNDNTSEWDLVGGDVDTTANCVTADNITELSSWTLSSGPANPTAVSLATIGVSNVSSGLGLFALALLVLFTSALLWFWRRSLTSIR